MAVYKTCSIKEVIARVIRNTGRKLPAQYYEDLLEWIPEAINQLRTYQNLITTSTPDFGTVGAYITKNHAVHLPCDLASIIAVEDKNGNRIRLGGDITDITRRTNSLQSSPITTSNSVWNMNPNYEDVDGNKVTPIFGEDVDSAIENSDQNIFYKVQLDTLQTSFESDFVKIHYKALPVDEEGYLLIPDEDNYKTALYWYVMKMLIGAGYEHKVFNYQFCDAEFEKYAGRALGKLKMPSADGMQKLYNSFVRLIPPARFHDDFFIGSDDVQQIFK